MNQKNYGKKQNLTVSDLRFSINEKQLQKPESQFNLELKFAENMDKDMEDSLWFGLFDLLGLLDKPTHEIQQEKQSNNPNHL